MMYALDFLKETGIIDYRLVDGPMDPMIEGESFSNLKKYRRLVGKLFFILILLGLICLLQLLLISSCRLRVLVIGLL